MIADLELNFLFNDIDSEHIALLRPLFERVSFHAGDTVIEQNAVAEFIYLIEHGKVEILYKPYDGAPITLTFLDAGSFFGWSALVGSPKYTSSCKAVDELEVLRMHGSDLRRLCAEHPETGRFILDRLASSVSGRWTDAHEQIRSLLTDGMKK